MILEALGFGEFLLEDRVGDFLKTFASAWLNGFVMVPLFLVLYWILSLPLKIMATRVKSYKQAMRLRSISDTILFFMICLLIYGSLLDDVFESSQADPWDYKEDVLLSFSLAVLLLVPLYQIMHKYLGRQRFYSEEHETYLKYFILFLRSFKDDDKWAKSEKKLMGALKKLFHPYAIGRPNELIPPHGAKRIYVGDGWKGVVISLQRRAPVILQRINMTENFLWEFDQCVQHGYLDKVIFWVTDFNDYDEFQEMVAKRYGLWFPRLFEEKNTELLFYRRGEEGFRIYPLRTKAKYKQLTDEYLKDHPELEEKLYNYFYGRDLSVWSILKATKQDPQLPEGICRWDWMAFFFPQFYVMCHSTKKKWWLYLISVILLLMFIDLNPFGLLYLCPMILLGKNGRELSWLSHRWESSDWFETCYRQSNKMVLILGITFWVAQVLTFLFWIGMR